MILLSRPKPTLTFLKQCLYQTIPGKSLHNGSTTDLKDKFLSLGIHSQASLLWLPTWICSFRLRQINTWQASTPDSVYPPLSSSTLSTYDELPWTPVPLVQTTFPAQIQNSFSSMPLGQSFLKSEHSENHHLCVMLTWLLRAQESITLPAPLLSHSCILTSSANWSHS